MSWVLLPTPLLLWQLSKGRLPLCRHSMFSLGRDFAEPPVEKPVLPHDPPWDPQLESQLLTRSQKPQHPARSA